MDPNVQIPFAIVASALSGALALGVSWGVARAKLAGLEKTIDEVKTGLGKRLDRLESTIDDHGKLIHEEAISLARAASKLSDISELKGKVVDEKVFDARMTAQDDAITELRFALDRKMSVPTMPRAEGGAAPIPPMRPRGPSRPGR